MEWLLQVHIVEPLVVVGLFIKNKIEEIKFQPLEKDLVLKVLKKVRK